jgi:hypothetical protein
MMKKLLVLALVLSMASTASAALNLSIGGVKTASEATVTVSDHLNLDVWTTANIAYLGGWNFLLVATPGGSIDYTSGHKVNPDSGVTLETGGNAHWYLKASSGLLPATEEGLGGNAFGMDEQTDEEGGALPSILAGAVLMDEYMFHCDSAPGDVTIKLYVLDASWTTITLRDSAVIHQVPEPITLTLLGLGGLFLRRRR